MFWTEQSIMGLIQGLTLNKMQLHAENIAYLSVYCGIPHHINIIIIISIQPEGWFLAGTRAQSGDRYGSGTLHSRQFLRGRLHYGLL